MVVVHSSDPSLAEHEIAGIQENHAIATRLGEIAQLLSDQHASDFRVQAYRAAAETIARLPTSIHSIFASEGIDGLVALPTIGKSIAKIIEDFLRLGRIPMLDRLRGEANAEHYFSTLPGIGPELSHRIHEQLHIETLPELFAAAKQGKLEQVQGLGRKRIRAIEESLASRIGRSAAGATAFPDTDRSVAVEELLAIDEEFRQKCDSGKLPKIAPTKNNPDKVAWLPILHTQRDERHYTVLFSNTTRAHELNTTRDWVIIYRDDLDAHGRWTVITSQFGKLRGCRIVRGREDECMEHYRHRTSFHQSEAGHPPFPELPTQWEEEQGRQDVHG